MDSWANALPVPTQTMAVRRRRLGKTVVFEQADLDFMSNFPQVFHWKLFIAGTNPDVKAL
jgi:hypothetical protein